MKKQVFILPLAVLAFFACGKSNKKSAKKKEYYIAYNVLTDDKTDNYEIFVMNLDGSGKQNITNHKDVAWTYYAYKDRLYFISDRDTSYRHYFLYEMDAQGNHVRKVSDLRLEDSWMGSRNDGKEMVVSARIAKQWRYQLFIIDTETGEYRQITKDTNTYFRDPCFSPDGKKIVAAVLKNRKDKSAHEELYIMDDDGGNMMQLTHYPENDTLIKRHGYKAGPPRWNAQENFITYQSEQNGKYSLYAVTPDGQKQWKLTENTQEEGWHDWSSDGKWLAIEMFDEAHKQFDIYLMKWENKELMKLTDTSYRFQQAPVFVEKVLE